ncbi:MAG: ATP-binding protein [Planctomycetia bacterium]|nr:ATP-binding protein [Planctomycetia bacterium]
MLVEFRVENFRSFRAEQTLSLVAASQKDASHRENLIACEKFDLLKTAAVYGANASGKSNLIRALEVMRRFVVRSATRMNLGDEIPGIVPFRLDRQSRESPTKFELSVILAEDLRVEYGFSATSTRVHDEWLVAYPPGKRTRGQCWFERRFDAATGKTVWTFRPPFKKAEANLLQERTRENGLVLSHAAQKNVSHLRSLYQWFHDRLWILDLSRSSPSLLKRAIMRLDRDPSIQADLSELIRQADVGIEQVVVSTQQEDSIESAGEAIRQRTLPFTNPGRVGESSGQKQLFFGRADPKLLALHRANDGDPDVCFDFFQDESNGTQRFFAAALPVLDALRRGTTLVVDELDCSMHPLLTRKLVELFQSPGANRGRAQLVFATHDTTLLDPALLRRDQVWLVEKKQSGASELFSLHDIESRPRHTEAFARNYLAGRYGAVPSFGPIFEDLELK